MVNTKGNVVGIVPTAKLFQKDDLYSDNYIFVNSYIKRICENGGIPIGILANDGYAIEDQLQLCDSFVICGGSRIYPYHMQVIDFAVKNKRPLLGICLGMQAICSYFKVREEAANRGYAGELLDLYDDMKNKHYMFTMPVEHHWDVSMTRTNIDTTKHRVNIVRNTNLHKILGKDVIYGATMHKYKVHEAPASVCVSGLADDGTVEGIEYKDYIIGVQFHPEVQREFDNLFNTLIIKNE